MSRRGRRKLFYGGGGGEGGQECRPPWLAHDEKLKKALAKTP